MKLTIVVLYFILFLYLLPQSHVVYATNTNTLCPTSGDFTGLPGCGSPVTNATISAYIANALTDLLVFAVILSLFFLIWGGIRWILSNGDKTKVTSARDTLVSALVGLVIALLAYAILNVVMTIVIGHGLTGFSLPPLTQPH